MDSFRQLLFMAASPLGSGPRLVYTGDRPGMNVYFISYIESKSRNNLSSINNTCHSLSRASVDL